MLGCLHRLHHVVHITFSGVQAFTLGVRIVSSEVRDDGALWDQVTLWRLEHRNEAAIDILVPLSLVSEVHVAVLKVYLFG